MGSGCHRWIHIGLGVGHTREWNCGKCVKIYFVALNGFIEKEIELLLQLYAGSLDLLIFDSL